MAQCNNSDDDDNNNINNNNNEEEEEEKKLFTHYQKRICPLVIALPVSCGEAVGVEK